MVNLVIILFFYKEKRKVEGIKGGNLLCAKKGKNKRREKPKRELKAITYTNAAFMEIFLLLFLLFFILFLLYIHICMYISYIAD